jgi:hypothetical protein
MTRAISIIAVTLIFTCAFPVAHAGPSDNCDEWVCGMNGTQLTGLRLPQPVASK